MGILHHLGINKHHKGIFMRYILEEINQDNPLKINTTTQNQILKLENKAKLNMFMGNSIKIEYHGTKLLYVVLTLKEYMGIEVGDT